MISDSTGTSRNRPIAVRATKWTLWRMLYSRYIKPKSADEVMRRKEFIFNVLMVSFLSLIVFACVTLLVHAPTQAPTATKVAPLILMIPIGVLFGLYLLSRRHFTDYLSYAFISIFLLLGTYALWSYGYVLPEGLLTYALVVVMAGILVSVRAAWIMFTLIAVALSGISYVQIHHITHPEVTDIFSPLRAVNVVLYLIFFLVILVISWLYNRDIESSLRRAHASERALKRERNSLEVKVRQRTCQLEQAHVENMLDLHRFAEFGRLSATMLHDLANPLTSVSLELEQLELKGYSAAIKRARAGITHMEEYVVAARRQLNSQSEETVFDTEDEITKVLAFLTPKAQNSQLRITSKLVSGARLLGDSIRFDQIVANLVANAIDASVLTSGKRAAIEVTTTATPTTVTLRVKDRGIGIPADELKKIFEPFYTTKQSERGTGIGLYITKHTVEGAFHGTIRVTSTSHAGTVFTVELPRATS